VQAEVTGTVREQLPSALYRVELEDGRMVTAHPGSGARRNFIRLLIGDKVAVTLMPGDPKRARVARKL
jgi:translation initiation factor IF-1